MSALFSLGKALARARAQADKSRQAIRHATIRDGQGDDATWWRLFAFSEAGCAELLGLHDGDGVAASGTFKAELYDARDGARISLTVLADRVISARRQKRERAQEHRAEQRSRPIDNAEATPPFDDEVGL